MTEQTKICPICGIKFETTYSFKKYCSPECCTKAQLNLQKIARERQRLEHRPKKVCLWCRSEFEINHYFSIYCCETCGAEYRKTRRKVMSRFSFNGERKRRELDELWEQGKNYVLPENRSVIKP